MLITGTLPASITLRTIAPFLLEGTCILLIFAAAVLLAIPLVSHIDTLFVKHKKSKINKLAEAPSAINYPSVPNFLPSATGIPSLSILHAVYPTRVNRSSEELIVNNDENCMIPVLSEVDKNNVEEKLCAISNDCTLVSYNSYRHKLIEETLRKQYGGGYAPGNVILNLIQLNTVDSKANLILAKKYNRSFFDHIQINEGVVISLGNSSESIRPLYNREIECPDPLDHFIPRNMRKPSTTETHTETTNPSEISVGIKSSAIPSARPNTPTSCQRISSKRSYREASYPTKSPFPTPVHSQAPLKVHVSLSQRSRNQRSDSNSPGRGEAANLLPNVVILRDQTPPLTEQLFIRNDTRPDVVSRTHVDAEEYLNRIAKNKRNEMIKKENIVQEPRFRSSLKKSRPAANGAKKFNREEKTNGDCNKIRRLKGNNTKNLSTSKPTIWNN